MVILVLFYIESKTRVAEVVVKTVSSNFDGRAWSILFSVHQTCTVQACRSRKSGLDVSSTEAGSSTTNVQHIIGFVINM